MSNRLADLKQRLQTLTAECDHTLRAAEESKRPLMPSDQIRLQHKQREMGAIEQQIAAIEKQNTIFSNFPGGMALTDAGSSDNRISSLPGALPPAFSGSLMKFIQSRGKAVGEGLEQFREREFGGFPIPASWQNRGRVSAALYEGSGGAGGYAVPITVDDQIVPLAPQEMGVRKLALVIPTTMDIKIPQKAAFGTATTVGELGTFGGSAVTLNQFTLSAFMAGSLEQISWELAQDVPAFQSFVVDDMILAQQMLEENLYVNGTGSGEAQGLIGNVGSGGTYEPDSNNNLVSIAGTLDLMSTLNAMYWPGASWLMSRPTSLIIRLAQMQQNLFFPAFTRVGGQDFLHGFPVEYSAYMPTAVRGAAPVLFGDFKRGYIIGDRGGSGINIKVLDQPYAAQGILGLLCYRRTDGRVRRSEAIQQYNIASS